MKNIIAYIIFILSLIQLILFVILFICDNKNTNDKIVSLPEEIQLVKKRDTLIVEQITKDSIIIDFKQKEKRFYNGE